MDQVGDVFLLVGGVVVAAMLAGIILHKILSLYIEQAIGSIECLLIAGAYVGLIISIITLNVLVAVPLAIALLGLLFYSITQDRRIIRRLYDDQIVRFREALEGDPKNLAARGRLAETLYKKGCLDEAIAEMTMVIQQSPDSKHESYLLREYIEEREARKSASIVCPSCGFRNSPGRTRCYHCERSIARKTGLRKQVAEYGSKRIAAMGAILVAIITIIVLALALHR